MKREQLAEEILLREQIRGAIRVVTSRRKKAAALAIAEEENLRNIIRGVITEAQSAVASVAKHDSTGINSLEDLLRNTNVLSVLETGYKSLTTNAEQRESYKNHILNAIESSLAPEESRKDAGEDVELVEAIDIDVASRPEDDPDFINIDDEEDTPEVDPKEEFGINGEDKTGRNRAFTDFQSIEKVILVAFDDLDNPEDISMFEEYLLKNIALYFEKFEGELATNVAPPQAADDATLDDGGDDLDSEMPEFELQEALKFLNIDDIIENLL
jgi:hypothetical protein